MKYLELCIVNDMVGKGRPEMISRRLLKENIDSMEEHRRKLIMKLYQNG